MMKAIRETLSGFKSLLVGMRVTLGEAVKPTITVQYPRETLKMPPRFRGHIKLTLDQETGKSLCTACGLCVRACPSECITVEGSKKEGEKRKSVDEYKLDFTTCSLCGSCIEVCASDAIQFSKDYNVVGFSRDDFNQMDLVKKLEAEAKIWAQNRPVPAAPIAPAAPVAPVAPAAPIASVAPVAPTAATPEPKPQAQPQ